LASWITRLIRLSGTCVLRGGLDLARQHRVLLRIEAVAARALAVHAGFQDQLEVLWLILYLDAAQCGR
jgi:hypothetical protein